MKINENKTHFVTAVFRLLGLRPKSVDQPLKKQVSRREFFKLSLDLSFEFSHVKILTIAFQKLSHPQLWRQ